MIRKVFILDFFVMIMENRKKRVWISAVSGAVGGMLGVTSGSNSLLVVFCVSAFAAALVAWGINGLIK